MSILLALSILSFVALLWASLAIARHIRAGNPSLSATQAADSRPRRPLQADLNETPLPRRLQQSPRRTAAAKGRQAA